VVAIEIMLNSPLISDLIFKGEVHEIKEIMKKSRELGMQTFDQALFDLYEATRSYEDALRNADSVNDLRLNIKLNSKNAKDRDFSAGPSTSAWSDRAGCGISSRHERFRLPGQRPRRRPHRPVALPRQGAPDREHRQRLRLHAAVQGTGRGLSPVPRARRRGAGLPLQPVRRPGAGGEAEIGAFCEKNYGVSFPLFAKIDVNGAGAHPLFQHLKHEAPGVLGTQLIKWNFTKFLVPAATTRRYCGACRPARRLVVQVVAQRAAAAGLGRDHQLHAQRIEHARGGGIDVRRHRRLHAAVQHQHLARMVRVGQRPACGRRRQLVLQLAARAAGAPAGPP
jgi:hypothetical protein